MAIDQRELVNFLNDTIRHVPYYHNLRQGEPVASLEEMPFLTAEIIARHTLPECRDLLRDDATNGYIFSSSGTSGNPKYTFYSVEEFDTAGRMLARGYEGRGLASGDMAANIFFAGNMWSSFMAVEKALAVMDVIQLPIGGTAEPELILGYLERFKPCAVFGSPSLITSLAQVSREKNLPVTVPLIFYAGEHMNRSAQKLLAENWKTEKFCSAGYASVDAGLIAYQCDHCKDKEHHLFSSHIHLEIVDGEAVVTSLLRKCMPFIRLRTGDRVRRLEAEPCPCGNRDPKFILLGRMDNQMNVLGCRVYFDDIEKAFTQNNIESPILQLHLTSSVEAGVLNEHIHITVEGDSQEAAVIEILKKSMFSNSLDIAKYLDYDWFRERVTVSFVPPGTIPRMKRTGKIKLIIDNREL